jgi:putative nucleotidyltransferase with HDIG domain
MIPAPKLSDSRRRERPPGSTLTRHIFVRVAFPVGILFLACFALLDQLVQGQMREYVKNEFRSWDVQTAQAMREDDARMERVLESLAVSSGALAALQRRPGSGLGESLQRIAATLDEDVYAIAGTDGKAILTLIRNGNALHEPAEPAPVPNKPRFVELAGQFYSFRSVPILRDGIPAGWIVTGRHWTRDLPLHAGTYLLASGGKILRSSAPHGDANWPAGAALPECRASEQACEVRHAEGQYMLARSALSGKGGAVEIYMARSIDLASSPLLGITRSLMLTGAALSILGALGLAVLTGRAISRPLRQIAETCRMAQDSGNFFEMDLPRSRIAEIHALGHTLKESLRTSEEGHAKLRQAYFQFMGAIVALLDARDKYTAGHSHRVSAYSEALARDFGLPPQQIDDIRIGALLHDIGKIGVPDEVLRKHERLTKEEFDLMKQHPTIGRKVLEQIVQFDRYLDAVELHHENLDGTGYPRGLRGEQIPISARIVKVADVYDALSTDRPYRKGLSRDEVHAILRDGAGTHFDRLLVEIFLTRSVPSFEQHSGLEKLGRALSENRAALSEAKAAGR